ncbi:MAG TPA: DUF5683 domain-containing protein [Dinghuibacter sp.]|jgi:hypothetical protein|uniref:DUF5683 domain-containing protein n=1 Tax=Dinghuibacter sp. TaxID=2024697 RepID=UPI002C4752A1|nr:DUF5683 domain-containing protein [Dinghuibacter sp.]HTJ12933.1 DUF5683 domain-containing protein [Dinghuibacter sp.]
MSRFKNISLLLLALSLSVFTRAQIVRIDSVQIQRPKEDTSDYETKHHRDPQKATIRSAIIPGWGQVYNHKYWKVPIVYGGLVTIALIFNYNIKQYKQLRHAYTVLTELQNGDSSQIRTIDTTFLLYSPQDVQFARNEARQNVDYSVLAFILMWGLNVIDATVDAHLHEFDVTDRLTLSLEPKSASTGGIAGLSLILDIHRKKFRPLPLLTNPIFASK